MTSIIRRDEVVRKQAEKDRAGVEQAIVRVNHLLEKAEVFPVIGTVQVLSDIPRIRNEIIRLLKEAGWRVDKKADSEDYEIQ